jgi:hypothetical protein
MAMCLIILTLVLLEAGLLESSVSIFLMTSMSQRRSAKMAMMGMVFSYLLLVLYFILVSFTHRLFVEELLRSGHPDIRNIKLMGRSFSRTKAAQKGIPLSLDIEQCGELMKAYEDAGESILITQGEARVRYFPGVSYRMRNLDGFAEVVVKAGDVVEVCYEDAADRQGFGRIIAIMKHQSFVFLVLRWIAETGRTHSQLDLPEFRDCELFEYSCFLPLALVDNQRFVNRVYFVEIKGRLYLNDWIFPVV